MAKHDPDWEEARQEVAALDEFWKRAADIRPYRLTKSQVEFARLKSHGTPNREAARRAGYSGHIDVTASKLCKHEGVMQLILDASEIGGEQDSIATPEEVLATVTFLSRYGQTEQVRTRAAEVLMKHHETFKAEGHVATAEEVLNGLCEAADPNYYGPPLLIAQALITGALLSDQGDPSAQAWAPPAEAVDWLRHHPGLVEIVTSNGAGHYLEAH